MAHLETNFGKRERSWIKLIESNASADPYFSWDYDVMSNAAGATNQIFIGTGLCCGFHCYAVGAADSMVTIMDSSDGVDGDTIWTFTNPTDGSEFYGSAIDNSLFRVTKTFGNAATDSNNLATWGGVDWWSQAGGRCTNESGDYMEIVLHTAGTNDIVMNAGGWAWGYDDAVIVTVDGETDASSPWDQSANLTYTIEDVRAGKHTIRITAVNAVDVTNPDPDTVMAISSIEYSSSNGMGDAIPVEFHHGLRVETDQGSGNAPLIVVYYRSF